MLSRTSSRVSPPTLLVEDACDERVAARVMIEKPSGKPDRRIRNPVNRLRAVRHLEAVAHAFLVEKVQLLACASSFS
jgi:hypothetical protein